MENCDKYEFDYWKRIQIKRAITPYFRHFSEYNGIFQGISMGRCDECLVEGYSDLGTPFVFEDLPTEELKCTLLKMGLKEIHPDELTVMPKLEEDERGEIVCGHCFETQEE